MALFVDVLIESSSILFEVCIRTPTSRPLSMRDGFFVSVLMIRALLLGVYTWAPTFSYMKDCLFCGCRYSKIPIMWGLY